MLFAIIMAGVTLFLLTISVLIAFIVRYFRAKKLKMALKEEEEKQT
jgi:hypothetical protein